MNTQELKQLSQEELQRKLLEARQALFHAREEVAAGKDKNHARLRTLRKDIAQINTCISELYQS